jgi:hypothetical protein
MLQHRRMLHCIMLIITVFRMLSTVEYNPCVHRSSLVLVDDSITKVILD